MKRLHINAHAKINLYLDIIGKRPDGYHDIESVFQSIGLADEFTLEKARQFAIKTDYPGSVNIQDDLVYRAAKLMKEKIGCPFEAVIKVKKNIPVAAGMAGGSADAAATLAGLDRLSGTALDHLELLKMASELGADVPFCLEGGTMFGSGKGDELEALQPLPPLDVVLAKPDFSISSHQLYQTWDECGETGKGGCVSRMLKAIARSDIETIAGSLFNALEQVAVRLHPEIERIRQAMLDAGALGARMSGSGPTVFALAGSLASAERIAREIDRICPYVMITKTYPKGLDITE